ncbi:MAG: GTP-binding protein [Rhodospirillaceae bacterium]|nr:GTP-binding protein [Rhodospirillaceae bacterium]
MPKDPSYRIPVFVLTGFLGAGKTTLLNRMLQDPAYARTAVIVNEFGEIGIDHDLVRSSSDQVVEMTTGCLCCTISGDISKTVYELILLRNQKRIPLFERIIIETTGLADPVPVLFTLLADPRLEPNITVGGVTTLVDAINGPSTIRQYPEAFKQILVADTIVVSKTDMLSETQYQANASEVYEALQGKNPGALLLDIADVHEDAGIAFSAAPYRAESRPEDVMRWLAEEKADKSHHDDHTHDHAHDINRHGDDIHAFSIEMDKPISRTVFLFAISILMANAGEDLLRVKGIVNVADSKGPMIVHGVQHVFPRPTKLQEWPSEDHRTRLMFITRNIPQQTIDSFMRAWGDSNEFGAGGPIL